MQPAIFISHGVPDSMIRETLIKQFFEKLSLKLKNRPPKAILIISSEWATEEVVISANFGNQLVYNKQHNKMHTLSYNSIKDIKAITQIENLLTKKNIDYSSNHERGFDFGVTNPLYKLFPENNIPVIQLSICPKLSPEYHFKLGEILSSLGAENFLIIGSGNLTENVSFSTPVIKELGYQAELPYTDDFVKWMTDKLANNSLDDLFKYKQLAPYALENNPRPHNLLPLFVVLGASQPQGLKRIHYSQDYAMAVDCYLSKSVIK